MKSQLKDDLAAMWQGITNFMLKIADKVKAVINNVKSMIKGFKDKFTGDVEGFKRTIRDLVEDGKRWLEGFGETIKNLFDFEWHLPELKLPHINVGGYIDVPVLGTIPDPTLLSIDWYKKAMHNGIVMDSPTIFGWDSKSGRFLAGGEAGTEIVVGATSLIDMIRSAVASSTSVISRDINSYCSAMVDAFVSAIDIISFVLGTLNEGFVSTNKALESTMSAVVSKRSEDFMSTYGVNSIYGNNTDVIDYYKLSQTFLDVLRTVQIVNNFNVEMEDGDVYLDNERVGRKIAPVVSRIQAKGV